MAVRWGNLSLITEALFQNYTDTLKGAETITPTIGWGILLLSQRPDIQKKALDAIQEAGTVDTDPFSTKEEVSYLMAFTKEVLRYYTPLRLALPKATSGEAIWEGHVSPRILWCE